MREAVSQTPVALTCGQVMTWTITKAKVYMYDLDSQYKRDAALRDCTNRWKRATDAVRKLPPLTEAESCLVGHWRAQLQSGAIYSVGVIEDGGAIQITICR